ncbi:MAG: hypothetical protein ACXIUM_00345 [Wenzhouxiangella sp.]
MHTRHLILTLAVLLLSACGSDTNETAARPAQPASASADAETGNEIIAMSAEDGWVALHDLDLPEPGTARLTVNGETIMLELECFGPGIIDHSGEVPPIMAARLFNAQFTSEGTMANGWRIQLSGYRRVVDAEEARRDLRYYRYLGMDRASLDSIVFDDEGRANASFQGGPNDRNRRGEGLPMLHVQADGSFTAVTEMISAATMIPGSHEFHRYAIAGPIELAGRCSQPWAELPFPGGISAAF